MIETAMEGMTMNVAYAAAILGATLGVSTFLYQFVREKRVRASFYKFADSELNAALISAERALKNGATPEPARKAILLMLQAISCPEVGQDFTERFIANQSKKAGKPGSVNDLTKAMDMLHSRNPALAADIHKAIMGMILSVPVMYAHKVEIDLLAVEGATNPDSVFDRALRALGRMNGNGPGGSAGGSQFAPC